MWLQARMYMLVGLMFTIILGFLLFVGGPIKKIESSPSIIFLVNVSISQLFSGFDVVAIKTPFSLLGSLTAVSFP